MIVNARIATRAVISRVRSSYDEVISAGIATYGTWKKAYAVAAATKKTSTHPASSTREPRSGAAKISAKAPASIDAGAQQPRPARPRRVDGAVADPPGDRVEQHVPRLGGEDDQSRPQRRDARGRR